MEDYKSRLISEQIELDEKLSRLLSFIETEGFNHIPLRQQSLLIAQSQTMDKYNNILKERLFQFENETKITNDKMVEFLKTCHFNFEKGQVHFSATMDKFTLFFNENGIDFFKVWDTYTFAEKDKMLQQCFMVK